MTGHDASEEKSFFTEINICELVCHQKKVCMSNYNAPRRKKIKQRDIKHLFSIHSGVRELAYVIPHFIHSYFDCNDNTSKRRNNSSLIRNYCSIHLKILTLNINIIQIWHQISR